MRKCKNKISLLALVIAIVIGVFLSSGLCFAVVQSSNNKDRDNSRCVPASSMVKFRADPGHYPGEEYLAPAQPNYVEGQVILKLKDNTHLSIVQKELKIKSVKPVFKHLKRLPKASKIPAGATKGNKAEAIRASAIKRGLDRVHLVHLPSGISIKDVLKKYKDDPRIEYIQPNYIYQPASTFPNDPHFGDQWALHNIGQEIVVDEELTIIGTPDADMDAPEAWDTVTGTTNVTVAVIDTGVCYVHPDLAANIWVNPGEDINDNGIAEGENFSDTGTDGKFSWEEEGYDPEENPDPAGDDWDEVTNPSGTEGNYVYDEGEPFEDLGLDAIGPENPSYEGPDTGEGNGSYDPGDRDGIDNDGNGYKDDIRGWDFANDDSDPRPEVPG